jgi:hypothetical protein
MRLNPSVARETLCISHHPGTVATSLRGHGFVDVENDMQTAFSSGKGVKEHGEPIKHSRRLEAFADEDYYKAYSGKQCRPSASALNENIV